MNDFEAGVGSFAAHCEGYGIPGFDSAQAAYDAAEPDNTDEDAEECTCRRRDCDDCGIGPDDARDYDDED